MNKLATLAALSGVLLLGTAAADELRPMPARNAVEQRQDKTALEQLDYRAMVCMRDAAPMRQRMSTDDDALAQWMVETCALPLGRFMVARMGLSQHDAAAYLFGMAHEAIRDARF